MKSTFSGCSNLTEVNFDGINTSKLIDMGKTFENCTELKKLDLSPIDTTNLINMENLFSGCNKLETINLSSFNSINNDIFNGIKSKPDIIANDLISNDISKIFKDLFSINI
jgi:surface protein